MKLIPQAPCPREPGPSRMLYELPEAASERDTLFEVLEETIHWCTSRATLDAPATCLRTPGFQPRVMIDADRFQMMERVISERHYALRGRPPRALPPREGGPLHGGRLLVYFPDDNTCDGAAELATRGYLDVDNMPPWDTWVGMFREDPESSTQSSDYLIAWVPPVFLDSVAQGIFVNPEQCIQWLEDSTTMMARRLKDLTSP
ncbi:hypothetical protein [Corallococcus sp. EGB]|uniref:hypothetical protein n=1 Tax=Corallococcus sp. EGB TaxID=1521117 RepID=UPI001CBE6B16|nr:hypothetical protein [Corallococcus sp. EGB]